MQSRVSQGLLDAPTATWNCCMSRPQQGMVGQPQAKRVRTPKIRMILFAPFAGDDPRIHAELLRAAQ